MRYTLVYRCNIKYCNYTCSYCPFSKYTLNENNIEKDKKMFKKFIAFLKSSEDNFKILIAPKGEVLGLDYYKNNLTELSNLPNIDELVIQTNLSGDLNWLKNVDRNNLKLWVTYHPHQVKLEKFLLQIEKLINLNVKFSVGTVGIKENINKICALKDKLLNIDKSIYLWINAYKDIKDYYSNEDINKLLEIDEYFNINNKNYICDYENCNAGKNVFWIEGNGIIHKCYRNNNPLGSLYKDKLNSLRDIPMKKNEICKCYTGYIHLQNLCLDLVYKESLLARIK